MVSTVAGELIPRHTPPAGFEPATRRLTVVGSTAELQRIGAEYRNRTGDERLETFSFASKLIPRGGSGGTRTPDQFIRSELLYPSELLTHVVVPIAANPELPRRSPQLISQPLYYRGCPHPCQAITSFDVY